MPYDFIFFEEFTSIDVSKHDIKGFLSFNYKYLHSFLLID